MSNVRISYSSVRRYKECAEKYFLYKKYSPKVMGSSLPFGKALDLAVESLLDAFKSENLTNLEDYQNLFDRLWHDLPPDNYNPSPTPVKDNLDFSYYLSDYDPNLVPDGYDLDYFLEVQAKIKSGKAVDEEDQKEFNHVSWLCLRAKGKLMLEAFWNEILPEIEEVVSTQEEINMENDQGDGKIGYIDCVLKLKGDDKPTIFDLKTAGRAYDVHTLETSEQLIGYLAAKEELNTDQVGYIVLLKKMKTEKTCNECGHVQENYRKRNCTECEKGKYTKIRPYAETQLLTTTVSTDKIEGLLEDESNIVTAIKNNIRFKNSASCTLYNRKCEYYDHCWNNTNLDDIKSITKREDK